MDVTDFSYIHFLITLYGAGHACSVSSSKKSSKRPYDIFRGQNYQAQRAGRRLSHAVAGKFSLCYDFTFYSQEGNDGFGSDIGWTCPSGSQLTQEIWAWDGHTDKPALATLELHANSSQEDYWGAATFTWWYESDFVTPEEVYEGEWGLTANGEYSGVLMLDMTRTGGKRYTPGETERIIHDGFIVQVPMAFEDYTYLSVDKGQHGSYLPIQLEPDTVIYFYPWWDL